MAHDSRSVLVVAHNAVNQALIGAALGTYCYFNLINTDAFCQHETQSYFMFFSIDLDQDLDPSTSGSWFRAIVELVHWISLFQKVTHHMYASTDLIRYDPFD